MDHLQYILHCNTLYIVLPTKYYTSVSYEESSSHSPLFFIPPSSPLLGRRSSLAASFILFFYRARINTVFRNYADTNIQYY